MRTRKWLAPTVLMAVLGDTGLAQQPISAAGDLPPQSIALADLKAFRSPSRNWSIAGTAIADQIAPSALTGATGSGTLLNTPSAGANGHLLTAWDHGDLDLSFDVLLPKGSNSGVYLMGRYEVQLFDSWGVRTPTFIDLGAIYQRWDDTRGRGKEGFEGTAPLQNASRAPGLWQHVDIVFRAPKFSGQRKVGNARFVKVVVNGVVVQENVEVSGPTRAAAFEDERMTGPLMLQGDHGAVAIRDIRYKRYDGAVALTKLRYRGYEGATIDSAYVATHVPVREGEAASIASDHASGSDKFALAYDGVLSAPAAGRYRFQLNLGWIGTDSATRGLGIGGGVLSLDGKPVLVHTGADRRGYADVDVSAGQHPFSLSFYKNRQGGRRDVTLWVEGPASARQALHDESAAGFGGGVPVNPIVVDTRMEPVVLRSFVRHRGIKRVIAASVADPLGVHFSYDLAQGSLLYVWRGPFLETTQMWHERGEDQVAEPLGSTLTLPGVPSLAFLSSADAAWPDSVTDGRAFRRDGYQLDKTGHPTFLYHVRDVAVEDDIRPDTSGFALQRELRFRALSGSTDGLFVQLAQGTHIVRQRDGTYVVGDRSFYVTVPSGSEQPVVRRQGERDELVLSVRFNRGEGRVVYGIIW